MFTALAIGGLIAANYYIWSHNASAIDDFFNGRPLDCADDIRTLQYWKGLLKTTAIGVALAAPVALAEAGIFAPGAVSAGYGLLGVAGTVTSVYQAGAEYQDGNYVSSVFYAATGVLSQFGAAKYMRGTKEPVIFGVRIAPYGNKTNNPYGQLPHYHRAVKNPNNP